VRVTETVYKGKLRPWGKTESSEGLCPAGEAIGCRTHRLAYPLHRTRRAGFHFPKQPRRFRGLRKLRGRVLEPIRLELSLPKLNFQILRRTYATRAVGERKGTLKDVQKQLRYSRPNTTLENYVKEIPESVYRMVDAMYDEITPEVKLLGGKQRSGESCAHPRYPVSQPIEHFLYTATEGNRLSV